MSAIAPPKASRRLGPVARRCTAFGLAVSGLVWALCAPPGRAQENPSRFLTATQWYGTFTRTLTANGSDTVGNCLATWRYNDTAVVQDRLVAGFSFPPVGVWMGTNGPISTGVNADERDDVVCPDGSDLGYRATGSHTVQGFTLSIDASRTNYTIWWPGLIADVSATYTGGSMPEVASWSLEGMATNPLPSSGMVITGAQSFDLPGLNGTTYLEGVSPRQTNGLLQLTWSLTPFLQDVELVAHIEDYHNWLPQGNLKDQNQRGNDLTISAYVQKKGGGATTAKADKFTFALTNVSHEPGVCMNRPAAAVASAGPDFKFEADLNQSPPLIQPLNLVDAFTAETTGPPSTNANARISCFDFGAYAAIQVTALVNGSNLVGYLDVDPTKSPGPIRLPDRAANSLVADHWKETNGVPNLGSNDDAEADPVGDGHTGDGFTLYEEYRGFAINGVHTRLNPRKKDLFVLNDAGLDGSLALTKLARRTGLEVHLIKGEEFGLQPDFTYSRILNFNHSADAPHAVDQHGIWVVSGDAATGVSEAENLPDFTHNSTPGTKARVRLDPGITGSVGTHVLGSDGSVQIYFYPQLTRRAAVAAHEICHCCSMYHHGDVYDTYEAKVTEGPDAAGQYKVDMYGDVRSFTLLHESGAPFEPILGATYYLGVYHGTHSGDESCWMRYSYSSGYLSQKDAFVIYLLDVAEVSGFLLCTSPAGTGINAPAPGLPWPRYGDADQAHKRGDCLHQVCVNDLYANDPNHQR